jgi:Subtilase family
MATVNPYSGNRVRVDEESVLARFADWHASIKGRPVAALGPETRDATLFVADEVIIDGDDHQLAKELQARYGAEIVPESPLPPPPSGLHRERCIELDAMPQAMRLRFAAPPHIDGVARLLEQAVADRSVSQGDIIVTSELGAAVAAVAARHALEGRAIGLNLFGETLAMPLSTAQEGTVPGIGNNPFNWQAFAGRTRMVDAWQLVDSIRQVRGNRSTIVGILDNGFWLDNRGVPMVAPGQAVSDFGGNFIQLNLQNENQPAGGMNPNGFAWHGNAVASAATATVNNSAGAAGSGGTVAFPLFFQTDISIDQILRCVRICAAWGIDVLNMSIGTWGQTELWFPTDVWNRTFQFAFDNGVVMIAAAGNNTLDLPDDRNIRPATRTPGVLTVGALDAADNAAGFSNYGSSVWLWAPGTSIPVAPDLASPAGSQVSGTSFASPIVAGVAAMMRFANQSLSAADIRRILIDTGWNGAGHVSKGLDAFAAVFAAIHHALPDTDEPNNTVASARELVATGPGGALAAGFGGFTARSSSTDPDYWKFRVEKFSIVTVTVDWYQRLSTLFVEVEADDPEARGPDEMTKTGSPQSGSFVLTGLLPPGAYRIRVGGTGATAYRLLVTRKLTPLLVDIFETNDSFTQAAHLLFETKIWTPFGLRTWSPGTYDATLHQERGVPVITGGVGGLLMNDDYFRLEVPGSINVSRRPTVSVHNADERVDVTLYDGVHAVIQSWVGVRNMTAYPPGNTTCFLKVSCTTPTRYQISTRMSVDPRTIPRPLQEELEILPKWWGDPPPLRLKEIVTHYVVEVNENRGDGEAIAFEYPAEAVRLELLNLAGEVVREAEALNGNLFIDTRNIERGLYVLRVSRAEDATHSFVQLRAVPPLR